MTDYNPTNNSVEHLEFTNTTQTIAIIDQDLHQWRVQRVSYTTSNDVTFPDIKFIIDDPVNGSQSWTYSSKFEYAVNRVVRFVILSDDQSTLIYDQVNNITKLPEIYDNLYSSDIPDRSMTVTFNLEGLQRTGSKSTGGDEGSGSGGTETITWGEWEPWNDTYTITIITNMDKHKQVLQAACMKQRFVQNSPTKPEW